MIPQEKINAVCQLYQEGLSMRKIGRILKLSRNTVRRIIQKDDGSFSSERSDKIHLQPELLEKLYKECDGVMQRVFEKLTEEHDISVSYATVMRRIHEQGLGKSPKLSCKVPDVPGEEMQHDTSPYKLKVGNERLYLQASLLYFRYSKIRYVRFYPSFTRFTMKCFFHEALTFWGYCAKNCIIDNTNLARLRGAGKNAIIAPEMEHFAKQFGFTFKCHEINHANRKAGIERSFRIINTNFLPGRTFSSLEDLNNQAFLWATQKLTNRPAGKTKLIPISAFEIEKSYLHKVYQLPPPYITHNRIVDHYGYVSFKGNYFWVSKVKKRQVKVFEYAYSIKIYHGHELLGAFDLPAFGIKNKNIGPKEGPQPPHKPQYRKKPTNEEEAKLRALSPEVNSSMSFIIREKNGKAKHECIRKVFGIYRKLSKELFLKTIERAAKYNITDVSVIENIAILLMKQKGVNLSFDIDFDYEKRDAYTEGLFHDDIDLTSYDSLGEDGDDE